MNNRRLALLALTLCAVTTAAPAQTPAPAQAPSVGQLAAPPAVVNRQAVDACVDAIRGQISGTFAPGHAEGGVPRDVHAGPQQDGFQLVTGQLEWALDPPATAGFACVIETARNQVVAYHVPQTPMRRPRPGPAAGGSSPEAEESVPASVFQGCVLAVRLQVQEAAGGRVSSIADPELQRSGGKLMLGGAGVVGPARQADGTSTPQRPFSYLCELTGNGEQLGQVSFRLLAPERAPRRQ
jgi:hypothetical protein